MQASAEDITAFKSVVKGVNFVTNKILRFERSGPFVIEIAQGEIFGDIIYGFTVVELLEKSAVRRYDLSESIKSSEEIDIKLKSLESFYDDFLKNFQSKYIQ